MAKVEIVLDTDVIIHFAKADCLSLLPTIFPEYHMVVLSTVCDELKGEIRNQLDNMILLLKNIEKKTFNPTKEMMLEYARLKLRFGEGESACMAYCRYTNNVIGSSNLNDIKAYCEENQLIYLTTIDFLYYAIKKRRMTIEQAHTFLRKVQAKGSILPLIDFNTFVSPVIV